VVVDSIARGDAAYPATLNDLPNPPKQLWWIGDLSVLDRPLVTIVGTRRATSYGERITRELAASLTRAGACVVSGMALGIDAAAHRAALEAGGPTIAILGTGADVAYPRAHVSLHRDIIRRGLVMSELPPGAHSHKGSFPNRNRILAAIATLTIIVEAPFDSGALITATHATELGRDVAIVPGPIDSPQSQGSNLLLRDGAHPIISIDDALSLAKLAPQPRSEPRVDDEVEMRVWNALRHGSATLDELCARSGLPVAECLTAVTGLELRGAVECALTGEVRRR
jgi:DNA processing protein